VNGEAEGGSATPSRSSSAVNWNRAETAVCDGWLSVSNHGIHYWFFYFLDFTIFTSERNLSYCTFGADQILVGDKQHSSAQLSWLMSPDKLMSLFVRFQIANNYVLLRLMKLSITLDMNNKGIRVCR